MTNGTTQKTETAGAFPTFPTFSSFPSFPSFGSLDPMAMWTTSQQTWQKLATDAYERAQSFANQYRAVESQMIDRAHEAITTWSQLTHDALAYGAQLSAEARKVAFDAVRKVTSSATSGPTAPAVPSVPTAPTAKA